MRRAGLGRRGLAAAVSIAAAAFPAAAGAGQSPCTPGAGPPLVDPSTAGGVNIHLTANNSVIWCSAQAIEANSDVANGTNYPLRSTNESPSANPVSNAISISHLLTVAGIDPATVNHTEVMRLNGTSTRLDNADLTDPAAAFVDGLPPIFFINTPQTFYLRPLRSPTDTNGSDEINVSNGEPLDFYIYSGPLLDVRASTNPTRVATNHPVMLTAQVTNYTTADGALTYTWSFQDGKTATGQTVTHSYAVPGTWYPVVTVRGAGNDSGGASQPVQVTVGSVPVGSGSGSPGGTNPSRHGPPGGPARGHGSQPNATPTHTNTGGSSANTASTPSTPTTPTSTTPSQTTTPHTTTPRTSTTPVSPKPAAGGVASARNGVHSERGHTTHNHTRTQPQPGPGALVDGRLISDVIPISAARLASQNPTAREASAPAARLGGGSIPPLAGIAGGCAFVLLLGSGAALELRSQRRALTPAHTT